MRIIKATKPSRFLELEGLRGLAAIAVVIYHFSLAFYLFAFFGPSLVSDTIKHFSLEDNLYANPIAGLLSGTFAVSIFFVLSGFVLSISFFKTKNVEIVKRLAIKRYPRLMLPALASVIICYALVKLGFSSSLQASAITQSSWLASGWDTAPHLFDVLYNGFIGVFIKGSPYNNVLWTMMTEFLGSFLVFGTLLMFSQSKHRWLIYLFIFYLTFNTWFIGFVIGMILADLFSMNIIKQKKRHPLLIVLLLAGSLYLGGYPFGTDLSSTAYGLFNKIPFQLVNYQMMCPALGAALVTFAVLWSGQLASILKKPIISGLGKYTFSLYLVHLPILFTFTTACFIYFYQYFGYNKSVLFSVLLSIPVLMVVTFLFEKFIDSPSIKFSSRFADVYMNSDRLSLFLYKSRK